MAQKPSIPKGTRDFNPSEIAKRNYIFDIIISFTRAPGTPFANPKPPLILLHRTSKNTQQLFLFNSRNKHKS